MNPSCSIIISFRNRDLQRVINSLESIALQTIQDCELIFVDYGSDAQVAKQVKQLVESYPFAKYFYSDTRGWLWNRAHALNTGIKIAKGEILIISDIDLVLPADFLDKVCQLPFEKNFYTFNCYYLPENSTIYNLSDKVLQQSEDRYVGLCAVKMEAVRSIQGFDEYFMDWGAEDDSFYKRVSEAGINRIQLSSNDFPVYHQWHPTQAPPKPTLWYCTMLHHLYNTTGRLGEDRTSVWGSMISTDDRYCLKLLENDRYLNCQRVNLSPYVIYSVNTFYDKFYNLNSGQVLITNYSLHNFPKGKLAGLTKKINHLLDKLKLSSYRILTVNAVKDENELHFNGIKEFIKYFIGNNRHELLDYYIEMNSESLFLILQRK